MGDYFREIMNDNSSKTYEIRPKEAQKRPGGFSTEDVRLN